MVKLTHSDILFLEKTVRFFKNDLIAYMEENPDETRQLEHMFDINIDRCDEMIIKLQEVIDTKAKRIAVK